MAVIALLAYAARKRPLAPEGSAPDPLVRLADIDTVFRLVEQTRKDGSFAVFLFGEDGREHAAVDALNVQFSIENGRIGLDWVLLAPLNIEARDRVTAFFEQRGNPLALRTMNGVPYLRTERGDLSALCRELLASVFGVTASQAMPLIPDGFTWQGH